MSRPIIDISGMIFNRLTVKKLIGKDKWGINYVWECDCSCGNTIVVQSTSLKSGLTQSCGCLRDELVSETQSKENHPYNLSGEFGIGFASNNNKEFYFDLDDYEKIKPYCWYMSERGYMSAHNPETKKSMKLHHFVIGFIKTKENAEVDHRDRNPSNNQKSNLRIVTRQINSRNRKDNYFNWDQ